MHSRPAWMFGPQVLHLHPPFCPAMCVSLPCLTRRCDFWQPPIVLGDVLTTKIHKGTRTGTMRLENLNLEKVPPSLMTLDVSKMMMIKEMYLDNNHLVRLPDQFGDLFNIYELRLMNNKLECLPASIGKLTNLQLLFLRSNNIKELPGEIGNCKAIQIFQLSLNPIVELPPQLGLLTKIRELHLDNTPLLRIPPAGVCAQGLRQMQIFLRNFYEAQASLKLNLSELKLDTMPSIAQFQGLTALEMLSNNISFLGPGVVRSYDLQKVILADNKFEQFPTEVVCFKSLVYLDLCFNKLESLPSDFRAITRLKELHLSHNFMREIPPAIGQLQVMTRFIGDDNFFVGVPDEIAYCAALTELVLSSNQIRELPPVVCMLSQLVLLDVSNNLLGELPDSIGLMDSLRTLNISSNLLWRLRCEVGELFPTINADKKDEEQCWKQSISYEHNPIRTPPREILRLGPRGALVYLASINKAKIDNVLDLSRQQLSSFPLEIWLLTGLLRLSIESNNISVIPPDIVSCPLLKELILSDNQIAMLPFQLGELLELQKLICTKNYVTKLPPDLMQCTNMTELNFAKNRLDALDVGVCNALCNLVLLNVESNMISVLPDVVQNLTRIESLLIGNNIISILPPSMFCMSSLSELGLSGNPLKSPPAELMKLPFPAPLNYLRQIHLAKQSGALDLTGFLLTAVPIVIQSLLNLSYIKMNTNRLRDFPPSLKVLTKLTKLELVENSFQSLPEEIVSFPFLNSVMLSNNEFLVWPEPISFCTNLTELEFRHNAMKEIPKSVKNLTLLTHLDMTGNEVCSPTTGFPPLLGGGGVSTTLQKNYNSPEAAARHRSRTTGPTDCVS